MVLNVLFGPVAMTSGSPETRPIQENCPLLNSTPSAPPSSEVIMPLVDISWMRNPSGFAF